MGTDLAQHGVQLPYVPYTYVPNIDELIREHKNIKSEQRKLLYPGEYVFDFDEENNWTSTFDAEEELEKVTTN